MIFSSSRLATMAAVAGLLLYGSLLVRHSYGAVGGADTAGYANAARAIVKRRIPQPVPLLDELQLPDRFTRLFPPLGYEPGPRPHTISPVYPVGVPLHMAGAALVVGWKYGPFLVSPLAALLSLLLIYWVGLELGLTRGLAVAGAVMLAANPTFFLYALQPMSDSLATCWTLATVWAALRSRRRDAWGLLAGAAFGMSALVRPSSLLLALPVLCGLRLTPRVLLLFVAGGLPAAAIFGAYNTAAYGHPLLTGYVATHHQDMVKLSYLTTRLPYYLYWLAVTMSPLPLLGWAGVALDRRVKLRDRALLITWFGVFLLFYSCYFHYEAWWFTRFLLPGIPALILGTLLVVRDLVKPSENSAAGRGRVWPYRAAVTILLAVAIGCGGYIVKRFSILNIGANEMVHANSCRWANRVMPREALVIAKEMSGALEYYTGRPTLRYERVEPDQWEMLQALAKLKGHHWYALLMEYEVESAQARLPGRWIRLGMLRHISLWRIEPPSEGDIGLN